MIMYVRKMAPLLFAAVLMASCSGSSTSTEEQTEITQMDSTAKAAEEATDKLEEQTKKVEANLENLDAETDSATK